MKKKHILATFGTLVLGMVLGFGVYVNAQTGSVGSAVSNVFGIEKLKEVRRDFQYKGDNDLNPGNLPLESGPITGKITGGILTAREFNRLLELASEGSEETQSLPTCPVGDFLRSTGTGWECFTDVVVVIPQWSDWGVCSASCGGGTQTRVCSGGTCTGNDTQACNTQPCSVNGECGTSNNVCRAGTLQDMNDSSTNYLFNCLGQNGGTNANCSILKPVSLIHGECGSASQRDTPVSTAPSNNLCNRGTAIPVLPEYSDVPTRTIGNWEWNCSTGLPGGISSLCGATALGSINSRCGTAHSGTFASAPTEGLCGSVVITPLIDNGSGWDWDCNGLFGGTSESCSATKTPVAINGACGTSNNVCRAGTLQDIADSSTNYLFNCIGQNGGTNANCSILKPVWGAWGACSAPCGGGTQTRVCSGGTCTGNDTQACNTQHCIFMVRQKGDKELATAKCPDNSVVASAAEARTRYSLWGYCAHYSNNPALQPNCNVTGSRHKDWDPVGTRGGAYRCRKDGIHGGQCDGLHVAITCKTVE